MNKYKIVNVLIIYCHVFHCCFLTDVMFLIFILFYPIDFYAIYPLTDYKFL